MERKVDCPETRYQMWHNMIFFYASAEVLAPELYISGLTTGLPLWDIREGLVADVRNAFNAPLGVIKLIWSYTFSQEDGDLVVASPDRYGAHWGRCIHRLCCSQLSVRNPATFYLVRRVITTIYSQCGGPLDYGQCCRDR